VCKALEEGILAPRKLVDDGCRDALRLGRGLEDLIGVEEASVHLKVGVVVLVEGVWCRRIEVGQDRSIAVQWAPLGKESPVPGVEGRVGPARAAEVVEPVRDELTLCPAKCVGPCMRAFFLVKIVGCVSADQK